MKSVSIFFIITIFKDGFVVEEAIGKEAVIRASQDGIDVSPITTNRNVMQLQDGGDDLQN
jgi:hypothetical protein